MITAKTYPPKSTQPVIVAVERHISRDVKGVRCIEENRYPYVDSDVTGTWSVDCGRAVKSNLFDLQSNRTISRR